MYRKFIETLRNWENKQEREPLMVIGARQIGKTWLIRRFCEETYSDYVYINLEERRDCVSAFEGSLEPTVILRNLEIILGRHIDENCAIFIDEIQQSEEAVTSLKYFCESTVNYRVICAGSLLGVRLRRFRSSFPVGKVRIAYMYPFDFDEFLIACGEEALRDAIVEAYQSLNALPKGVHDKALKLYHDYMFVGGMPRIVADYLENDRDIMKSDMEILRNLRFAYQADMNKYITGSAEAAKISAVYESIPRQLGRDNPKFKYSDIGKQANKRDYAAPIDWLDASAMVIKLNKLDAIRSPLVGYADADSFKIYLSDVGMLANMCGLSVRDMFSDEHNVYRGAVVENYVIQQLIASNKQIFYFKPSESMEIDIVWDDGESIVPIEIKSGRHKRSTSLKNYMEKYSPKYAIILSELNFSRKDNLYSIPLYAAFCI